MSGKRARILMALALALLPALRGGATAAPLAGVTVSGGRVAFGYTVFDGSEGLLVGIGGDNDATSDALDLYGGVLFPDGDTLVFVTAAGPHAASLNGPPSEFAPLVTLGPGAAIRWPAPFGHDGLPLDLVPGAYLAFAALVRPGSLADGTIDPGDILDVATTEISFVWAPWPDEVRPILGRLPVAPGTHLFLSANLCTSAEGPWCDARPREGILSFYDDGLAEIVLRSEWATFNGETPYDEIVMVVAHEICHAHQHRAVLEAGLPVGPDYDLATQWYQTEEGRAFLSVGGHALLPGHEYIDPFQDFANVCAFWYLRREILREADPRMYQLAALLLPE